MRIRPNRTNSYFCTEVVSTAVEGNRSKTASRKGSKLGRGDSLWKRREFEAEETTSLMISEVVEESLGGKVRLDTRP